MSAGGGLLSQVVGSLGGAPMAAALVAGGIVVGALGGGAVAGGVFSGGSPATSTGELAVYPCPDAGPALYSVPGGQRFLVTGRTEDSAWLRIHNPLPGDTEAWIQADPVTVKGSLDDVVVATCAREIEAEDAPGKPNPSLTAIQRNSPTPTPSPTPSPEPTENPRPGLKGLTASTGKISYDTGAYCPKAVKKVTFKVKASDSVGVASVVLFWRKPGAESYAQAPMDRTAGSETNGTWQVTLDTTANNITKAGKLAFYAVATDIGGATRRLPNKGADNIAVAVCVNTGPTIRSAASSSGSSLSWDPLGVENCRTTTNITAAVSDVDGVESVTLFFRRPGDANWSPKPMSIVSGRWSANLDTGRDQISIPNPPTGNLRWYVKAVDKTGLASQTKAASITIKRCDSEATFFVNSLRTSYGYCPPGTTSVNLSWSFSITDVDGLAKATLSYKIVNPRTGATYSGKKTVTVAGQRFSITSAALDGKAFSGDNIVTWTITTIDQYDGRSSADGKATVTILQLC